MLHREIGMWICSSLAQQVTKQAQPSHPEFPELLLLWDEQTNVPASSSSSRRSYTHDQIIPMVSVNLRTYRL